jgi:outer membrane protein OmpA-like peptidoglycan-associated protein
MSYFAPVFGWRGHGMLRFAQLRSFAPHLVLGAGGETIASSSPFMSKETDPVVYYGAGATFAINDQWRVRIDIRHGIMSGRENLTSTLEAQFGVQARFGLPTKRVHVTPPPVEKKTEVVAKVPDDDVDTDGDGITDRLDLCPREPETVNGVDDGDGCPEADPDGDGILANDKCPNEPEDFDGWQDDDGCPDPDNDGDGIPDAKDACPNQPETKNGVDDADGCPDTVPDNIVKALAVGKTLRFEYNRARVTPLAATNLKPLHLMLLAHPDVSITITGVPEKTGNGDLARRRAEAVKWFLVDQGITESRIDFAVANTVAKPGAPVIELSLRIKELPAK